MTDNYSSIYSIKDFIIKNVAPSFFDLEEVNQLNVGLLGYTTEIVSNLTEDTFNAVGSLINEMFPNLAVLPESIYNYASLFQISDIFSSPAKLKAVFYILEDDILKYGTKVNSDASTSNDDLYEFYLDSDMVIDVDGITFSPIYDIRITFKPYRNDYIYTAMHNRKKYNTSFNNDFIKITNPYLKLKKINYDGRNYIMMGLEIYQINKFSKTESIIGNDLINLPSYSIEFDGNLAGFDIFYKDPSTNLYSQLIKRMDGSTPLKEPFCFYRMKDENELEITFTSKDNYFQPKYGGELYIHYYTTIGSSGNFDIYTGDNVNIQSNAETYDYNDKITLICQPISESSGGADKMSLDQLKTLAVEMFSTVGSYTTENDLELYFKSFNSKFNSNVLFVKKRDDMVERLFSAYTLLKDSKNDIYHTNTLNLVIPITELTESNEQTDTCIIKPGSLFTYYGESARRIKYVPNTPLSDYSKVPAEFVYTNPFMIYVIKDPLTVGYYINSMDNTYELDYDEINNYSLVQFITKDLIVKRNSLADENDYRIELSLTATTELDNPPIKISEEDNSETKTDSIVVRMEITDGTNTIGFTDMELTEFDTETDIYTFSTKLTTDDYVNKNNKFKVYNLYSYDDESQTYVKAQKLIPMENCKIKFSVYYKYAENVTDTETAAEVDNNQPRVLDNYTITNIYSTTTNPVTFIFPIQMVRSTAKYTIDENINIDDADSENDGGVTTPQYNIEILSSPVVGASTIIDYDSSYEFFQYLTKQYNFMYNGLSNITNNYSVDMKFYNTYGKSNNFTIGDEGDRLLDKVNISIHIKIKLAFGESEEIVVRDLKMYIKKYIESINESENNSFYVSNLIQSIENDFSSVKYMKFVSINNLGSDIQVIDNNSINLDELTKEQRKIYVPEYLTISLDDIRVDII